MFKHKEIEIAYNHLDLSIKESEKAIKEVIELAKSIKDENISSTIIEKLQFQDILAQRLKKIQNFLKELDNKIDSFKDDKELKEFAWEKEVAQEDIDDILKSHGI